MNGANTLTDGRHPMPRFLLGRIKAHTSFIMRQKQLHTMPGGLWAVRSKVIPIRDRTHQINVVRYIRKHADEGAAIWSELKKTISQNQE